MSGTLANPESHPKGYSVTQLVPLNPRFGATIALDSRPDSQ